MLGQPTWCRAVLDPRLFWDWVCAETPGTPALGGTFFSPTIDASGAKARGKRAPFLGTAETSATERF